MSGLIFEYIERAWDAEASTIKKYHDVKDLYFQGNEMGVTIDGQTRRFDLGDVSPALQKASVKARNTYEISPSGYGIHWPSIDEDLSIDGLLGIVHAPQTILTGTQTPHTINS